MKKLVGSGATFVGRTHASQVNHMIQRAMDHQGFSVIEWSRRKWCEMDVAYALRRI